MNNESNHTDPAGLLPKIFSGEATPSEQREVSEWLLSGEENRKTYESFRQLWNMTAPITGDEIDIDSEWLKMEKSISPARSIQPNYLTILKIAASVVLVSMLALAGMRLATIKTLKAGGAGIAEYVLPDGTKISLNAGSKIIYKKGFGNSHRKIDLKGEGFFEVEKSQVPFIINAGYAEIRVTGTKFNVSAYPGKTELKVTVTEGRVRLSGTEGQDNGIELKSGETGVFNNVNRTIKRDSSYDLNTIAWKTGIMEFNNASLINVTQILENTYHIPFSVDTAVMNCTITVRFENQDADSVLNVLRSTLDLEITRKGKKVVITGTGC